MGYDPKKALLVGVILPNGEDIDHEESLLELKELACNLDYDVKESILVKVRKPQARFLTGPGKAEELIALAKSHKCGSILLMSPFFLPSNGIGKRSASLM